MPSAGQVKKEQRIEEIKTIYEESHEIYGASKIAAKTRQKGDQVSGRTVGKDMRETWIRACYRKHRTRTTEGCDFDSGLKNIPDRGFQPERPDAAWCTDNGPWRALYTWPALWICIRGRAFPGHWGRRWRRNGCWRPWKRRKRNDVWSSL